MARTRPMIALLSGLVAYAGCGPGAQRSDAADAGELDGGAELPDSRALLRIERPDSGALVLEARAEVARTEAERRRGLRGHVPLAPGEALLIELSLELDDICVVNNGVSFEIDAVFARADGTVVAVERAIPAGDASARCHDQTRWIVETAAGQARSVWPSDRLSVFAGSPVAGSACSCSGATRCSRLRLGARDYLTKPCHTDRILAAFEAESEPLTEELEFQTPSFARLCDTSWPSSRWRAEGRAVFSLCANSPHSQRGGAHLRVSAQ
jgi:uncharacterized membrane protein (UPF0127 family)